MNTVMSVASSAIGALEQKGQQANAPLRDGDSLLRTFPILASAGIPSFCPDACADALWVASKRLAFNCLIEKIKEVDAAFPTDPRERKERLRDLSREHHILHIMDRVRRKTLGECDERNTAKIMNAAKYILDRNLYPKDGDKPFDAGSIEDRRALVAARVNWHKLMVAAGAKPPGREGGWSPHERVFRGSAKLFRSLERRGGNKAQRDELLRAYIEQRLEHLAAVAREVVGSDRRAQRRDVHLLMDEIELSLKRARKWKSKVHEDDRPDN